MEGMKRLKIQLLFLILLALYDGALSVWAFMHNDTFGGAIFAFASFLGTGAFLYTLYKLLWMKRGMEILDVREIKVLLIFIGIITLGNAVFSVWAFMQGATISGAFFALFFLITAWGFLHTLHKLLKRKDK